MVDVVDLSSGASSRDFLRQMGLSHPQPDSLRGSDRSFADGAPYRVEIPSVEGPACLNAVIEQARRLDVPVHRVSQGSGAFLLTDQEIAEMARMASGASMEVSLFARPTAGWDISAASRSLGGAAISESARGEEQVVAQLDDIRRAASFGIRSVLIADVGVLSCFNEMRAVGLVPREMQAKVSAMFPITNSATARILEGLGANTLNLATDLTLRQIATIRVAVSIPLDIYVEAPDSLGGFLRYHELPDLVRVAAPVYLKFGLRNAPDVYPSGSHLDDLTVRLSMERVRRARLGIELLGRCGVLPPSWGPAPDLAIPAWSGQTGTDHASAQGHQYAGPGELS